MKLLLLDTVLLSGVLELALALQRQRVVLEDDLDIFPLHVGKLRLQHELLLGVLEDVHGRHPPAVGQQISERIETNHGHYLASANSASTTSPSLAASAGFSWFGTFCAAFAACSFW